MSLVQYADVTVSIKDIVRKNDFRMRELDKRTIAEYAENISAILETSPIAVFETDSGLLLVDGFHRFAAAKQMNLEQVKVHKYKGSEQDAFSFACLANLKHGKPMTADERKNAICHYIKLNVRMSDRLIAQETGKDDKTIGNYRHELESKGEIEVQETRTGLDGKNRKSTAEISAVEPEKKPDPFDVWFDEHVVQGDALAILEKDQLMYDLAIVDPPYGITNETWDKKDKFDLLNFTRRWLNLVLQKLKPTGRLFVFWSREHLFDLKPLLDEIKNEYPLNFGGIIVWNFRNITSKPNNQKEFKITWEPIFYFYKDDAPKLNNPDTENEDKEWTSETGDSDVWTYAIPQSNYNDKRIHPAQKPVELYQHIIEKTTRTNDRILDPFAGSGTTGEAAYKLNRNFLLIEKEPSYVLAMKAKLREVFRNGQ